MTHTAACLLPALLSLGRPAAESELQRFTEEALRRAIPFSAEDVRISRLRLPKVRLPVGSYSARAELRANERFRGPTTFAVVLTTPKDEVHLWATADVRVRVRTLVVARDLPRGHVLRAGDLQVVRRELGETAQMGLSDPADAVARRLRRPLRAQEAFAATDLERVPILQRGAAVTLVARSGGLFITARGRALDAGASGDTVRVVNLNSGKTVLGRVESERQIAVEF
jgi:flagella basal body P-ring formation protein FlgA